MSIHAAAIAAQRTAAIGQSELGCCLVPATRPRVHWPCSPASQNNVTAQSALMALIARSISDLHLRSPPLSTPAPRAEHLATPAGESSIATTPFPSPIHGASRRRVASFAASARVDRDAALPHRGTAQRLSRVSRSSVRRRRRTDTHRHASLSETPDLRADCLLSDDESDSERSLTRIPGDSVTTRTRTVQRNLTLWS